MTTPARQLAAHDLGGGRWRVELALESPARPHPSAVSLHPMTGDVTARVESLVIARPSQRERFEVVLAVDAPLRDGARFELRGPQWSAQVELTPSESPLPRHRHAAAPVPASIDYTARDFEALRTMLLAVVDEQFGATLADHPVAQTAALVEQLAYLGDALGYHQDALMTEAYLASARRRISVARHAALLDYPVFEGRGARTWLRFEVSEPLKLPAHTAVLTDAGDTGPRLTADALPRAIADGALVYETLAAVALEPARAPHELAEDRHPHRCLPEGAVTATLAGQCSDLARGTLVLVEPALAGATAGGQVVRLTDVRVGSAQTVVAWAQRDALNAALTSAREPLHLLAGNLVLADHGHTQQPQVLEAPVAGRRYWPALPVPSPAFSAGLHHRDRELSAAESLRAADRPARPAVELWVGRAPHARKWIQRDSLLESGPGDPAFVVELEEDGEARVRFGDATNGLRPPPGAHIETRMRCGTGSAGNVRAGAIAHVVSADERLLGVRNPMPAVGGRDPQSLTSVRIGAPRAFRFTDRAVTAPQYSAAALAVQGVTNATTSIVPSGSGPLACVRVFNGDWSASPARVVERVHAELQRRRPVGVALDVRAATPMPVSVELVIAVRHGWTLAAMSAAIRDVLRAALLGPRRFGFGTGLHRSDLIRLVAAVPGVADVTLARFAWTGAAEDSPAQEHLEPPFGHIIRIADDTVPGHGSISFRLRAAA